MSSTQTAGTGLSPTWPTQGLPPGDALQTLGARRAGAKTEKLTLDFGNDQTCDVDDPTWRKYTDGQSVKVEVRARSSEFVCGSL